MRPRALLLTRVRDNREMQELAFSLGYDVVETMYQGRARPDPEYYVGSGKLAEARERARELGATRVLVNDALKPGQMFSLFRFLNEGAREGEEVEVLDRIRVILDIFAERAASQEARLQVELAKLHYEIPLVKEAIHRLKVGERPGFLGGGEYEVSQYQDMIKRRMSKIKEDLGKVSRERDVRRKHRRRGGFHLVSLAGYTNAGKSSLLEALAGTRTLVENRYFSTLGTKTRRATGTSRDVLVTDTVGFIEDLPPWLVEAFHSTLEEIALADLILLVVDVSDSLDEIRRKLQTSLDVLWEFQVPQTRGDGLQERTPVLVVFNKCDLLPPADLMRRIEALREEGPLTDDFVAVSARTGTGMHVLNEAINRSLPGYTRLRLEFPASGDAERLISHLHDEADIVAVERDLNQGRRVGVEADIRDVDTTRFTNRVEALGGAWERVDDETTDNHEVPHGLVPGASGDASSPLDPANAQPAEGGVGDDGQPPADDRPSG